MHRITNNKIYVNKYILWFYFHVLICCYGNIFIILSINFVILLCIIKSDLS